MRTTVRTRLDEDRDYHGGRACRASLPGLALSIVGPQLKTSIVASIRRSRSLQWESLPDREGRGQAARDGEVGPARPRPAHRRRRDSEQGDVKTRLGSAASLRRQHLVTRSGPRYACRAWDCDRSHLRRSLRRSSWTRPILVGRRFARASKRPGAATRSPLRTTRPMRGPRRASCPSAYTRGTTNDRALAAVPEQRSRARDRRRLGRFSGHRAGRLAGGCG
jgi:hypothetical protein